MSLLPIHYDTFKSPLGKILIAARGKKIIGLWFEGQKYEAHPDEDWTRKPDDPVLIDAIQQVKEYFSGKRSDFKMLLDLGGTEFQQTVWQELQKIPSGSTITYGELANRIGKPAAVRAAAAAVGKNPASVVVPCHRVLGANGSLTGYAGGLDRKEHLLKLEA